MYRYIYIYIDFSSMHLGRSEHRVTLPVMRTAVKRKGYIIPTKPDLYTPSPPRCHRKLVFHGVAACGDVSESRYYEGAAAPLPPPPPDPFIRSSTIRFSFSSAVFFLPAPSTKGIRNNSSNSLGETGSTFTRYHAEKSWHNRRGE